MVKKMSPAFRKEDFHAKRLAVFGFDGAEPHVKARIDADIEAECQRHGFSIKTEKQPAKLPLS